MKINVEVLVLVDAADQEDAEKLVENLIEDFPGRGLFGATDPIMPIAIVKSASVEASAIRRYKL